MISIRLEDWFAKVPTYAKSMPQHMSQQQKVSLETSSQSSDFHPIIASFQLKGSSNTATFARSLPS